MQENPIIVAIVEGDGEERAVPQLIRKILGRRRLRYDITVPRPIVAKGEGTFDKKVEQFLRYAIKAGCDGILVLMDADDNCPYEKARNISLRASTMGLNVPTVIVYAKSEYETWFISSLSGHTGDGIKNRLGLDQSVNAPDNVEDIRGAKEWLRSRMPAGRRYSETSDQEQLTPHIDFDLTHRRSRSFRRLCHAVEELVDAMDGNSIIVTPS